MRCRILMIVAVPAVALVTGCTQSEEKPAPAATAIASPVAAGTAPAAADADEGEEILMVWAEAEPEEGAPPLTVQLKADISGGKGERKIKWDFGDGSPTSAEVNPTHTYQKAGTYRASVEVTDSTPNAPDSDSDYVDIEVGTE